MYSGHQRSSGTNRSGNAGNPSHNHHHQPGNKNRSNGNSNDSRISHPRYPSGNPSNNNPKLNSSSSSNPSGSSSGNSSISSNTSSNNGTNQSPTSSSASGSNAKNMGPSDWNQYCNEWNKYLAKGRQTGRESFTHNSNNHNSNPNNHSNSSTGPSDGANVNLNVVTARTEISSGPEKWTGSINQNVQGPPMPEANGATLKENYQTIEGEKKVNSANDCDPNVMVKPYIPNYSNSNRFNSRGNWNNRGGRGGKGRGFNNSNNRGGGGGGGVVDNRGLIQYQPHHGGYYTAPMPTHMSAGGMGLPVDPYGGYNFISVAPFQFAPYLCGGESDYQICSPAQTCYSPANGYLQPQYYSLPATALQYVPVSIGAPPLPGTIPTAPAGLIPPTSGPPLPPPPANTLPPLPPPQDTYSCTTLDIMNNISTD